MSRVGPLLVFAILLCSSHAEARSWSFDGRITATFCKLKLLKERFPGKQALIDVDYRVQARLGIGPWATWKAGKLDRAGRFRFSVNKSNLARTLRLQIRFQNHRLKIAKGAAGVRSMWHTVYVSGKTRKGIRADFSLSQESLGSCSPLRLSHAELWVAAEKLFKEFAVLGHRFKKQVKVRYPVNNPLIGDKIELSYAGLIDRWISLVKNTQKDQLDERTIWHEIAHMWAFQHSLGEHRVIAEFLKDHSTHSVQEKPFVAFHEGFASFIAHHMFHRILRRQLQVPFSPRYLNVPQLRLDSIARLERSDYGWMSILHTLTMARVIDYDFNSSDVLVPLRQPVPTGRCSGQRRVTLKGLLNTFKAHPRLGLPKAIKAREMTFDGFYRRAAKVNSSLPASLRLKFRTLLTSSNQIQPYELFCAGPTKRKRAPRIRR